ncbi:MAG TPA: cupin domain-containing protein [Noviherbaspirillum sp.]|nr:cupin domain-containing protein [Noviherbaspirillum sp.]
MIDIIPFDAASVAPVDDPVVPERHVSGHPKRTAWPQYANASGEFKCGIWESAKGAWRTVFHQSKDEYFVVLEGRVRLCAEGGEPRELGPGDACVIPAGFVGIFEVVEPVRKHYVIFERAARA